MSEKNLIALGAVLAAVTIISQVQKRRGPKIFYVTGLPFGFHAMTVPPIGIFVEVDQKENLLLLQHELIHWEQFKKFGWLGYYLQYGLEYVTAGYDNMSMEKEARFLETDFCKNNYTACVQDGTAATVTDPEFRK